MGFQIEDVVAHWDRVAYKYDDSNRHRLNPHHWRFIEGIRHITPSDSPDISVLSIWSRTGDAIPYIRKTLPNARLYNFEVSSVMISIAEKKYPSEQFYRPDLSTIDLPGNSIDYILCPETLEHTPCPPKLLSEFRRVLKSNGRLILSLPPRIADIYQFIWETTVGGHGAGPRRGIISRVVLSFLRETGFQVLEHKAILLFPIGPLWLIRFGNWILDKLPFLRELGIMQFYICMKN